MKLGVIDSNVASRMEHKNEIKIAEQAKITSINIFFANFSYDIFPIGYIMRR